jgi:tetratricopeptide (TPR) repeat protein
VDVRQIAENLRVKYILEGSIQRKIDRIRIAAKLIDGETGRHIWSDRWDRPAEDLFTVQSELSETVARRLASYGVIEQAELQIAKRKLPEDLGAYELFLLGLEAQHKQTKEGMDEALHLLGKAVERDPNLARAWVALGWTHAASVGFGADAEIAKKGEEEAAKRALALDPMDGEAHALMGEVYAFRGDFTRALAAFERALSLNPNNTASLMVYSLWASALGQPEQGAEAADRLIRLDPNYPVWVGHGASYAYFMVGRYEDVLRVLERIPNENLRYWELVYRAASYAVLGRTDEAKAAVAYALTRFPDLSIEGFLSNTPYSDAEQRRLIETMRQAGFPACATDDLARSSAAVHLPECRGAQPPA